MEGAGPLRFLGASPLTPDSLLSRVLCPSPRAREFDWALVTICRPGPQSLGHSGTLIWRVPFKKTDLPIACGLELFFVLLR